MDTYVIPVVAVFSEAYKYDRQPLAPCKECGTMSWEYIYVPAWQHKLTEAHQELYICSHCRDHWYSILSMTLRQIYNERRAMSGHLQAVLGMVGFRSFDPIRSGSIPCPHCLSANLSAYITNINTLFRINPYTLPVEITPSSVLSNCRKIRSEEEKRTPEEVKVGLHCDVCDYTFTPSDISKSLKVYEECEALCRMAGYGSFLIEKSSEHSHSGKQVDPTLTLVLYIYKVYLKNEAPSVRRLLYLFPQISRELAGRLVVQASIVLDRRYAALSCVA